MAMEKKVVEPHVEPISLDETASAIHSSVSRSESRLKKWKVTIATGTLAAVIIMGANIAIYVVLKMKYPVVEGFSTVYTGDCSKMKEINMATNLVINILSTILLAASNNGMQCLSAPTRKDIDGAHRKGTWLDIGVSSLRNLKHISSWRVILWTCLGLSSIPLHLL